MTDYKNIYAKKNYSTQNSLDFKKVILQTMIVDEIYESFENDNYTPGVFIHLPKAFDTVDHLPLLKKLEMYGVNTMNLAWFEITGYKYN